MIFVMHIALPPFKQQSLSSPASYTCHCLSHLSCSVILAPVIQIRGLISQSRYGEWERETVSREILGDTQWGNNNGQSVGEQWGILSGGILRHTQWRNTEEYSVGEYWGILSGGTLRNTQWGNNGAYSSVEEYWGILSEEHRGAVSGKIPRDSQWENNGG